MSDTFSPQPPTRPSIKPLENSGRLAEIERRRKAEIEALPGIKSYRRIYASDSELEGSAGETAKQIMRKLDQDPRQFFDDITKDPERTEMSKTLARDAVTALDKINIKYDAIVNGIAPLEPEEGSVAAPSTPEPEPAPQPNESNKETLRTLQNISLGSVIFVGENTYRIKAVPNPLNGGVYSLEFFGKPDQQGGITLNVSELIQKLKSGKMKVREDEGPFTDVEHEPLAPTPEPDPSKRIEFSANPVTVQEPGVPSAQAEQPKEFHFGNLAAVPDVVDLSGDLEALKRAPEVPQNPERAIDAKEQANQDRIRAIDTEMAKLKEEMDAIRKLLQGGKVKKNF